MNEPCLIEEQVSQQATNLVLSSAQSFAQIKDAHQAARCHSPALSGFTRRVLTLGMQVRKITQTGTSAEILNQILNHVMVQEKGVIASLEKDPWKVASQFYLLTIHGEPAGCARTVDPRKLPGGALFFDAEERPLRFPMEKAIDLRQTLVSNDHLIETGRFAILPKYRGMGGLEMLMGTGYLYALRHGFDGAVCLANSSMVAAYQRIGWRPVGEVFTCPVHHAPSQVLRISTKEVKACWSSLFLEMEAVGIIDF